MSIGITNTENIITMAGTQYIASINGKHNAKKCLQPLSVGRKRLGAKMHN